jgi:LacI family transcriptional regulator, galactose operon repressor
VTIHDVAARAGVSVATVSRVLNRNAPVRQETLQHVQDVARRLRYVPNTAARALSIRRSHTIGVVLPDTHGEFFSEVIRGIDVAARKSGFHILVSGSHSDADEMLAVLEAMRGRVDGLLVMAPDVAIDSIVEQIPSELPLVLLNAASDAHHAITVDNYGGASAMTRHLISLGHTRIAFIKGPENNADARERLRGFRQAMRQIGVRDRKLECRGDFTEESGCEAGKVLIGMGPRPTAIFAANDSMAIGALSALSDAGLEVPDDVAVAGFDDIRVCRYVTPSLTTVHVDVDELGRRAFEVVFDAIEHPSSGECRRESITTSLVVRNSTKIRPHGRKGGSSS